MNHPDDKLDHKNHTYQKESDPLLSHDKTMEKASEKLDNDHTDNKCGGFLNVPKTILIIVSVFISYIITGSMLGKASTSTSHRQQQLVASPPLQQISSPTSFLIESNVNENDGSSLLPTSASTCLACLNGFQKHKIHVPTDKKGFPSFWTYHNDENVVNNNNMTSHGHGVGPMNVSYDGRSFFINSERVLFLSGSIHPARATPETWNYVLDEAVNHGLNMVTIYLIWAEHQPFPNTKMNWNFKLRVPVLNTTKQDNRSHDNFYYYKEDWNLASAIQSAASRGLFVHLRIGPYVCGEYNYGGIPEWVPLNSIHANLHMRRYNRQWMKIMKDFVVETIQYIRQNQLFAYQGGPIVMAQIENEIGGNKQENITQLQQYADWCGSMAKSIEPQVIWTMCQGLNAKDTILSCNGEGDCSTAWLEDYGGNNSHHRIQIDQPAMFTEMEGGFQIWGDDPKHPTTYFWGRRVRDITYNVMRWIARGGTHLNYYMWWGGYNRRRGAALGITNMYASDTFLCPSGHRREPKYSHSQALHKALISIAHTLLYSPTALLKNQTIQYLNSTNDIWEEGPNQRMFLYQTASTTATTKSTTTYYQAGRRREGEVSEEEKRKQQQEVIFVENDADAITMVRVPLRRQYPHLLNSTTVRNNGNDQPGYDNHEQHQYILYEMMPKSSVLIVNGVVTFDSGRIQQDFMKFERRTIFDPVALIGPTSKCIEIIGTDGDENDRSYMTVVSKKPIEQTELNIGSKVFSDYAWYETRFFISNNDDNHDKETIILYNATIFIDTQLGSAFTAYLDGKFIGSAYNFTHLDEACTLKITFDGIHYDNGDENNDNNVLVMSPGWHKLSLLSESLGYHNLIGRWGVSTTVKTKGITGDVFIVANDVNGNEVVFDLVDGVNEWKSFPGLHGNVDETDGKLYCKDGYDSSSNDESKNYEHTEKLPTWFSFEFPTPKYDPVRQGLFLDMTSGRGHIWLNGNDLGKFWNITRGESLVNYSQRYYFLPNELMLPIPAPVPKNHKKSLVANALAAGAVGGSSTISNGSSGLNQLVIFDSLGEDEGSYSFPSNSYNFEHPRPRLLLSWIDRSNASSSSLNFLDEVDYPLACML